MLSEGSSVKGSPEDKQPSGPCIKGGAKLSQRVTLAHYTGGVFLGGCLPGRGCPPGGYIPAWPGHVCLPGWAYTQPLTDRHL